MRPSESRAARTTSSGRLRLAAAAAGCGLVAAACAGTGPAVGASAGKLVRGCPDRALLGRLAARHPQRLDVDGDGRADAVSTFVVARARVRCRAYVAARVDGRLLTRVVRSPYLDSSSAAGLAAGGMPILGGGAPIDERPGAEILVTVQQGASLATVEAFTVAGGSLRPLLIRRRQTAKAGLFTSGGSISLFGADCLRGGRVAVTKASPLELGSSRWTVTRSLYKRGRGELVFASTGVRRGLSFAAVRGNYPELNVNVFRRCR